MSEQTREQLKKYFETGDIPTQEQFASLIDSYIHKLDDNVTIYQGPTGKRFGVGTTEPKSPVGIQAESADSAISMTSFDGTSEWHLAMKASPGGEPGFSVDEQTPAGRLTRLFIEKGTAKVGMGTSEPTTKLHVTDSNSDSATAVKIENAQVGSEPGVLNRGWQLGHIHDPSFPERMGAFSVLEETTSTSLSERITVLPTQNVGINESLPDATLHVNRSVTDPLTKVQLIQGTGIAMLGALEGNNLVLDYEAIQARTGFFDSVTGVMTISNSALQLQPLGGAVKVHGDSTQADDTKVTITSAGMMSIGLPEPTERLHINGALIVGNTSTTTPEEGTIRYNTSTSDLEGYAGGQWNSMTGISGSGFWQSAGTDMIRYNPTDAKVAIGTATPLATLHVENDGEVADGNSVGLLINNTAVISTPGGIGTRVGLKVTTDQQWSTSTSSINVAFAARAAGMTNADQNIAASLAGNVVIGTLMAQNVGEGGDNVLAIQNGAVPAGPVGASDSGIQIYSADLNSTTISVFNVMNGDGNVVRLYRQSGNMTAASTSTPNTGDTTTDALISNMRTRINELETILKNLGILAP